MTYFKHSINIYLCSPLQQPAGIQSGFASKSNNKKKVNYSENRKSSIKTEGKSHSCTTYSKPFQVNSF